eukprot:gene18547-20408_t
MDNDSDNGVQAEPRVGQERMEAGNENTYAGNRRSQRIGSEWSQFGTKDRPPVCDVSSLRSTQTLGASRI